VEYYSVLTAVLSSVLFSCVRTVSALVCVDMVAMDIHWVPLPSLATPSSLSLAESSQGNRVWLTIGGHTHFLLDFSDDQVVLETTLSNGFPFVGVLDDSGSWDGHAIDARVEGVVDEKNRKRKVVLQYHDKNGIEKEGEYLISDPRGKPVMVRSYEGCGLGCGQCKCGCGLEMCVQVRV